VYVIRFLFQNNGERFAMWVRRQISGPSQSLFRTDGRSVGQSVSPSWRRAPFETRDQLLMCCPIITGLVVMERSCLTGRRVYFCQASLSRR